MMRFVENGDYYCAMFMCNNKARHAQKTSKGTILLCSECFGKAWRMSELGIKRLKEDEKL